MKIETLVNLEIHPNQWLAWNSKQLIYIIEKEKIWNQSSKFHSTRKLNGKQEQINPLEGHKKRNVKKN